MSASVWVLAQDATFRAASDLVRVYASVTRADGQNVRELGADDFQIFDNGVPREVALFSDDVQPITVALVVDESGSMLPRLKRVDAAAEAFVDRLLPGDRASFSTLSHEGVALTGDKARLVTAIRAAADFRWWDDGSPLWGALDRGMTALATEGGRRVLVVITDGLDTPFAYNNRPSAVSRPVAVPKAIGADVARRAVREGFMLYLLGFAGAAFEPGARDIARQSGGTFDLLAPDADMAAAFTAIVDDLHRQYLLGFVPTSFDGQEHTIEVRCLERGTSVRARASYIAQ